MSGWLWDQNCLPALARLLEAEAEADERLADGLLARAADRRQEAARVRELAEEQADVDAVAALAGAPARAAGAGGVGADR